MFAVVCCLSLLVGDCCLFVDCCLLFGVRFFIDCCLWCVACCSLLRVVRRVVLVVVCCSFVCSSFGDVLCSMFGV